jgi:hypothetical protein
MADCGLGVGSGESGNNFFDPIPHSLLPSSNPQSAICNPQSSASGFIFRAGRRRVNLTTVRRILPCALVICGYSRDQAA